MKLKYNGGTIELKNTELTKCPVYADCMDENGKVSMQLAYTIWEVAGEVDDESTSNK